LGARLFGVASRAREALGTLAGGSPATRARREAALEAARRELGPESLAKAWAEGASMPVERAVAYALRGRGQRHQGLTGWESLTGPEREVATLAGEGLTNSEIAERLFISPRTVQRHLSNVFLKLRISSRRELRGRTPATGDHS
ncbi:MAG TPA: helix-turn-helix transcriptional regulator, partial [bacterium]|nr:helix-turn-helix transcriptional regulator [bacterium]